ncbi:hypothetical protein DYH09_20030 [bacterium CPR1]|nr:hypothetical protein [bacterium CPR1]
MQIGLIGYNAAQSSRSFSFREPNPELEVRSDFEDAFSRILSEPQPYNGNLTMSAHWTLQEGGWYSYEQDQMRLRRMQAGARCVY